MTSRTQQMIDAWGRAKYAAAISRLRPHERAKIGDAPTITIELIEGNDGFCETCDSPYAALSVCANGVEVDELRDVNMVELLAEIMAADKEADRE